jgi:uncharacterized protein (DUF2132 family)
LSLNYFFLQGKHLKSLRKWVIGLVQGAKLANVLEYLVDNWGWDFMYAEVDIKCFVFDPSINSSLKFLRNKKFEWVSAPFEKHFSVFDS